MHVLKVNDSVSLPLIVHNPCRFVSPLTQISPTWTLDSVPQLCDKVVHISLLQLHYKRGLICKLINDILHTAILKTNPHNLFCGLITNINQDLHILWKATSKCQHKSHGIPMFCITSNINSHITQSCMLY